MPGLRLRPEDKRAYQLVFSHELLLRRILRWELRGGFGALWYAQLGSYAGEIETRMRSERSKGLLDPFVSELAYLDLSDLADIVCGLQWDGVFAKIFATTLPKHLMRQGFRDVVAVRNKVAHFRPVLSSASEDQFTKSFLEACQRHYQLRLAAAVHLSGDPSKSGDQFGTPELEALQILLAQQHLETVWEEYGKLEDIRASGLSPGLGVVDRHLFFEIYGDGSFSGSRIGDWASKEKHAVTFVTVGRYANYVRAFMPLKCRAKDIAKAMRGLASAARLGATTVWKKDNEVSDDFDFGAVEWLNGEAHNTLLGFVF